MDEFYLDKPPRDIARSIFVDQGLSPVISTKIAKARSIKKEDMHKRPASLIAI